MSSISPSQRGFPIRDDLRPRAALPFSLQFRHNFRFLCGSHRRPETMHLGIERF
jgi:hypothetical protein